MPFAERSHHSESGIGGGVCFVLVNERSRLRTRATRVAWPVFGIRAIYCKEFRQ